MRKIKNIVICGLGAIGGYYASKIYENPDYCLKILVDNERLIRYKSEPRNINGKEYSFEYILPESTFNADLIIIATKSSGLDEAIANIKGFITNETTILSFLNGITSEERIASVYGKEKVLASFLLGHTFFRRDKYIEHDGNAKVYFGNPWRDSSDNVEWVKTCFDEIGIDYCVQKDILTAMWNKFCFNCCVNQISALTKMTFGEMKLSAKCLDIIKNISDEISAIANVVGITGYECFYENTLKSLEIMLPEGKTSMLQDIEAGIKPEIDIFGKTVVTLGEKYGVETPYNRVISDMIDLL